MQPKISVIIPTFRRADLLVEVLHSLIAQPLQEIEIVVMDDGSDDDTREKTLAIRDERIRYWNLGKLGVPEIVNAGIERSSAPYVMFLHDHDRIEPELLIELSGALDRNPSATFAFCGYVFYDSTMTTEQERWLLDLPELTEGSAFLREVLMPRINSPVLALSMVRRSALGGELLDPAIGGCADVELWHRLASRGDVAYVRKPLISIRGRDEASQFSNARSALDLMAKSVKAKDKFLSRGQSEENKRFTDAWRKQISAGGAYIAWKAIEGHDRETMRDAQSYVSQFGTPSGAAALSLLNVLPQPLSLAILRGLRAVARRVRGNTL